MWMNFLVWRPVWREFVWVWTKKKCFNLTLKRAPQTFFARNSLKILSWNLAAWSLKGKLNSLINMMKTFFPFFVQNFSRLLSFPTIATMSNRIFFHVASRKRSLRRRKIHFQCIFFSIGCISNHAFQNTAHRYPRLGICGNFHAAW